jgi:hypothetical protein
MEQSKHTFKVLCEERAVNEYTIEIEAKTREEAKKKLLSLDEDDVFLKCEVVDEKILEVISTYETTIKEEE